MNKRFRKRRKRACHMGRRKNAALRLQRCLAKGQEVEAGFCLARVRATQYADLLALFLRDTSTARVYSLD